MDEEHDEPVDTAADASAPESAAGGDDLSRDGGEPATRLVLVLVGIAILGLATWWLSPAEETPQPQSTPESESAAPATVPEIVISVFGGVDDRYFVEPCSAIRGGGLMAFRAAVDLAREETFRNHLGVSLGDLTRVPGRMGIGAHSIILPEVLPETGIDVLAAGIGEMQFGIAYARGALANTGRISVLCANAVDADGNQVLRRWALTSSGGHNVLTVAVAAESIGYELVELGSDIRIAPPVAAVKDALEQATQRANDGGSIPATRLLLVQGTVEEAREIASAVPGFDAVVASRGGILPDLAPADADGTPVFYPGRGARFVWQLAKGGRLAELQHRLTRIGDRATSRGSPYETLLYGIGAHFMMAGYPNLALEDSRVPDARGEYVGAAACAECHPDEVVQHAASPHTRLPEAVVKGPYAGSPACLGCHVTAPFRRSGWLPAGEHEDLGGVSCERCHGPASSHVAEPGPGYGSVDYALCYSCHLPDRTPGFDARASWMLSGHAAPPPPHEEEGVDVLTPDDGTERDTDSDTDTGDGD